MSKWVLSVLLVFLLLIVVAFAPPNPPVSTRHLNVFGTEYFTGDSGKIFVQAVEGEIVINNASCILNLYYPNNTRFLTNASMLFLGENGLYYYDIAVPNITGVYMTAVYCYYDIATNYYNVSNWSLVWGTETLAPFTIVYTSNDLRHTIEENISNISVYELKFIYNFSNIVEDWTWVTELNLLWEGQWEEFTHVEERVNISLWNFVTSSWHNLPNNIYYSATDYFVSNSIFSNFQDYVSNGKLRVKFEDTYKNDTASKEKGTIATDYFVLRIFRKTPTPITEQRGGGEMHVNPKIKTEFIMERTELNSTCIGNDSVLRYENITFCNKDNECQNEILNFTEYCPYGCDNGKCIEPTWNMVYIIIFFLIFIALILVIYKLR